jgi:hypothetical protein
VAKGYAESWAGEPLVAALMALVGLGEHPRNLVDFVIEARCGELVNVYVKYRPGGKTEAECKEIVSAAMKDSKFLQAQQARVLGSGEEVSVKPDCTVEVK